MVKSSLKKHHHPAPLEASVQSFPWIKTSEGGLLLVTLHVKPGSKIRSATASQDQLDIAIDAPVIPVPGCGFVLNVTMGKQGN